MKKLKIGILGTGNVGMALRKGLLDLGHEVMMGSRNPKNATDIGTLVEAVDFGELIVLAIPGIAVKDTIRSIGVEHFNEKVILDATNPILANDGEVPTLSFGHSDSLGERVQKMIPAAKVVKAFNTVGYGLMINPQFTDAKPDMFIAGNDSGAKSLVSELCECFGWGVVDLGAIERSRELEAMVMAWIHYGLNSNTWNHAFKLLRK